MHRDSIEAVYANRKKDRTDIETEKNLYNAIIMGFSTTVLENTTEQHERIRQSMYKLKVTIKSEKNLIIGLKDRSSMEHK